MTETRATTSGMRAVLQTVALVCLAVLVVFRAYADHRRIHLLRGELGRLSDQFDAVAARRKEAERDLLYFKRLAAHSSLDANVMLRGYDLDSNQISITFRDLRRPLLLYSIDPQCVPCLDNVPFLNQIASLCGVSVVGIGVANLHSLDQFRLTERTLFPVLRGTQGSVWELLPLAQSPVIVVMNPGGRVGGWWVGRLSLEAEREVAKSLGTACPSGVLDRRH
ncbi:MAG TPA: hypothetical protein VI729_08915 [Anaerolineales bacterium]|nr:hypothetical protein [Anaerolineales bacterium]